MTALFIAAVITGTFALCALLAWLAPNVGSTILPEADPEPLYPDTTAERDAAFLRRCEQEYRAGSYQRNFGDSPANQRQAAPWFGSDGAA
jgi:hypothetical protein